MAIYAVCERSGSGICEAFEAERRFADAEVDAVDVEARREDGGDIGN